MTTLSPHTVIRAEPNGALMFQQETAETALLDLQGLEALYFLLKGGGREYPIFFARYLRGKQFIVPGSSDSDNGGALERVEAVREAAPHTTAPLRSLAAPETIHFSVTGRCDQVCAGCFYSARPGSDVAAEHAPLSLFEKVIHEASQAKVFQIALGGGEPLLHPRLVDMARLARAQGIVPNLTTNGNRLDREMAEALKEAGLGQAQISLNGATEATNATTRPNFAAAMGAIEACRAAGLRFGINFLLTRSSLPELRPVIELGRCLGAASVNLLRPKPPTTEGDWLERESPDAVDYRAVRRILRQLQVPGSQPETRNSKPETKITLDASLSFLLTGESPRASSPSRHRGLLCGAQVRHRAARRQRASLQPRALVRRGRRRGDARLAHIAGIRSLPGAGRGNAGPLRQLQLPGDLPGLSGGGHGLRR